jgi:hypothetical protein
MKRKNTPLAALTCASLLGSAALSQAAVIVSESFDTNGALNGQTGGTGFSGAWTSSINVSSGVVTGTILELEAFLPLCYYRNTLGVLRLGELC